MVASAERKTTEDVFFVDIRECCDIEEIHYVGRYQIQKNTLRVDHTHCEEAHYRSVTQMHSDAAIATPSSQRALSSSIQPIHEGMIKP